MESNNNLHLQILTNDIKETKTEKSDQPPVSITMDPELKPIIFKNSKGYDKTRLKQIKERQG